MGAAGWQFFLACLVRAWLAAAPLVQVQVAGLPAGAPAAAAEAAGVAGEIEVVTPSVDERYRPPGKGQVAAAVGAMAVLGAVWGGAVATAARALAAALALWVQEAQA